MKPKEKAMEWVRAHEFAERVGAPDPPEGFRMEVAKAMNLIEDLVVQIQTMEKVRCDGCGRSLGELGQRTTCVDDGHAELLKIYNKLEPKKEPT